MEPEQLMLFAQRNQIDIPFKTLADVKAAYNFSKLQDFLDIYYQGMSVLRTEVDFYELTDAYIQQCLRNNICHVEVSFDPQGHTSRGLPFSTAINGIVLALENAENEHGITHRLIMSFLRHMDEASAFETLAAAEPYLSKIHAVGLDSSELDNPPSKFERVFAAARAKGLKLVAHAGEEGPPSYINQALDVLRIDRIDHGNRLLEDDILISKVLSGGYTMTICPLSNLALNVVQDMKSHPLKHMLELGLRVTVNSDDPAYFGGYLNRNFEEVATALELDEDDVITLVKNSFRGSFLSEEEKTSHLEKVDRIVKIQSLV